MIKSVVKAINILRALSDADGRSLTLDEICGITGYNKSTCAHLLETLVAENMAEHISRKEGYSIGYGAFMLSRFGGYNHRLKTLTHPVLKWLTAKTGETAIFCVLKGDRRVCIDCVIGEFPLGSGEESIRVEKLPGASTGAVLIANLPEDRMREFSGKHREVVAAMCEDSGELENTLSQIRRLGYGENCSGEGEETLRGFAVPVFKGGECLGAIGMPYRGERKPSHLKYLRMAAREIARRIEFAEL